MKQAIRVVRSSYGKSDDDRVKPKEVAGWVGLGLAAYFGWKFLGPDDDDKKEAWMNAALQRFGYYRSFGQAAQFVAIAKKWDEDHKPDHLPSTGGTKILVGDGAMKASDGICKAIYDSKGFFGDNENLMYQAISRIRNLAHIYYIQERWKALKYSGDFIGYIGSFTNDEEKIRCVVIWDQLPYYDGGAKRKVDKPKREWLKDL